MSMTKNGYEAIARLIDVAAHNPSHFYVSGEDRYKQGCYSVAVAFANHCAAENGAFKRDKFLKACGVES